MSLEKLKQEAEALQNTDISQMTPSELSDFVEKLAFILEKSEESLKNTTLLEINKPEEENDETDN
jgi:acyl-CoA reductase-like NAD-dependent aldehyde dehydrogenase